MRSTRSDSLAAAHRATESRRTLRQRRREKERGPGGAKSSFGSCAAKSRSKLAAHGEERELLVRLAEARREHADAVPKDLVGELLVHEEEIVEGVFRDDE